MSMINGGFINSENTCDRMCQYNAPVLYNIHIWTGSWIKKFSDSISLRQIWLCVYDSLFLFGYVRSNRVREKRNQMDKNSFRFALLPSSETSPVFHSYWLPVEYITPIPRTTISPLCPVFFRLCLCEETVIDQR